MGKKVQQKPPAPYFEDYDDDADSVIPHTRQSANITAKRSKSDLRPPEPGHLDFASDSGYSSRTAATGNSSQSRSSGKPGVVAVNVDPNLHAKAVEAARLRESRKDKGKQREEKRASADMLHINTKLGAPPPRSSSKSRRRESMTMQRLPEGYWQYPNGYPNTPGYPIPHPVEPRPVDYSAFYYTQPTPIHDIPPPSPQTSRYPYPYGPEVHVAQSPQRPGRPTRPATYHMEGRPVSYHEAMPDGMYNPGALPISSFDHGPPPAFPAFFTQPSTPHQQYYNEPGSPYQAVYERPRASSTARPKEQRRRSSVYGRPVVEHTTPKASYEDGPSLERQMSREHRSRRPSESRRPIEPNDLDEDYYRMPPPPPPAPAKPKSKAAPKIIQKRPELSHKSATTGSLPPTNRRMSHSRDSMDLSDLRQALPHQQLRKISGAPERSQSLKASRRMSYHSSDNGRRIAVEDPRRRRTLYHDDERATQREPAIDLEQKHRTAEEYQAAKSGRTGVPLTADALRLKAQINAQRQESDSGSQKSRSNSSRGSDARTRDGSGVGSRFGDDGSFTMTMNGMTMSFTGESVNGKTIHLRTDDQGAIGLNIEGRRPKRYIMPSGSDFTAASSRKEIEDGRRAREDRRSDRASRLSSRSTFSGH